MKAIRHLLTIASVVLAMVACKFNNQAVIRSTPAPAVYRVAENCQITTGRSAQKQSLYVDVALDKSTGLMTVVGYIPLAQNEKDTNSTKPEAGASSQANATGVSGERPSVSQGSTGESSQFRCPKDFLNSKGDKCVILEGEVNSIEKTGGSLYRISMNQEKSFLRTFTQESDNPDVIRELSFQTIQSAGGGALQDNEFTISYFKKVTKDQESTQNNRLDSAQDKSANGAGTQRPEAKQENKQVDTTIAFRTAKNCTFENLDFIFKSLQKNPQSMAHQTLYQCTPQGAQAAFAVSLASDQTIWINREAFKVLSVTRATDFDGSHVFALELGQATGTSHPPSVLGTLRLSYTVDPSSSAKKPKSYEWKKAGGTLENGSCSKINVAGPQDFLDFPALEKLEGSFKSTLPSTTRP